MGLEFAFVLIIPVALACMVFAVQRWWPLAALRRGLSGYLPLALGFTLSVAGLALVTYVLCNADFTDLVRQGYYRESDRAIYLARRVVGQLIVNLLLALPIMSFIVIPWTKRLVADFRLSLAVITLRVALAWALVAALAFLAGLGGPIQAFDPPIYLAIVATPFFLCGLPIPLVAKWWFGGTRPMKTVPAQ